MEKLPTLESIMTHSEFNHIVESLNGLSPEQMRQLRRELDGKLATVATKQPAGNDLGSIGAMREDADFLDEIVADAMKARQEQPWRLPLGE
jgi:hypothetical protein